MIVRSTTFFAGLLVSLWLASPSAAQTPEAAPGADPEPDFARSRLHLAGELLRESRYEEALELYREIELSQPGHSKAVRGIKTCYLELKRYDDLYEILQEELARTPEHPAVLEELGTVEARRGNREAALEWWRKILLVQQGTRGSYSFVADLLQRNRMLDEALAIYAEADEKYPGRFTRQKASLHELRFEFETATAEYLRFLEGSPTALSYVEGRLLRIGESEEGLDGVIARVEAWIEAMRTPNATGTSRPIGSNEVVFRKLLGDLYLESQNHEKASRHYFRLVDDAPNQFSSLLVFGKRCQSDGQYEVAIQVFNRIIRDFPNARAVPSALSEIATCEAQLGRWDEALKTHQRLIEGYPETDFALSARYESGRILREGKRDPDAAEELFRELTHVKDGPWAEADPQFEVAECAIWRGDLERAEGIYRAIEERPFASATKERALYERARAIFYQANFSQADSLFKAVAQRHSDGRHVNDALAYSILINTNADGDAVLGKYASARHAVRTQAVSEAIEVLEAIGKDHPGALIRDEALLLLGEAYRSAGDPRTALEVLERAVDEAQVMDLAADARLLRAQILREDQNDRAAALAEYEELLVTYPETLAADRARDLSADLMRTFP